MNGLNILSNSDEVISIIKRKENDRCSILIEIAEMWRYRIFLRTLPI
jgi:hypothetical protein